MRLPRPVRQRIVLRTVAEAVLSSSFDWRKQGKAPISLVVGSRRLHLYSPKSLSSFLHEQRLTVQVCFTSGLLLTGTLYIVRAEDIPRGIVLMTLVLVTICPCLRRLIYRPLMYRRFERGEDTRNILIVGTGAKAHALRQHLESIRHLGYTFKGFIEFPGASWQMMSSSPIENTPRAQWTNAHEF